MERVIMPSQCPAKSLCRALETYKGPGDISVDQRMHLLTGIPYTLHVAGINVRECRAANPGKCVLGDEKIDPLMMALFPDNVELQ